MRHHILPALAAATALAIGGAIPTFAAPQPDAPATDVAVGDATSPATLSSSDAVSAELAMMNHDQDLRALEILFSKASALHAKDFTEETWTVLVDAMVQAQSVLAKWSPTDAEVANALATLSVGWFGLRTLDGLPYAGANGPITGEQVPPPDMPEPHSDPVRAIIKVSSAQKRINLLPGQRVTIPSFGYDSTGLRLPVLWKSSKPKVASVSDKGVIKARKAGNVTITVTAGHLNRTIKVQVYGKKPANSKAKKIKIQGVPANRTLEMGDLVWLHGKVVPASAIRARVHYSSSNRSVIEVGPAGRLMAHSSGHATITVKSGRVSAKVTLTVP